jgi:TPR repeat protein
VKEAAERNADEQRRALQQQRDKTEKLATELTEAKSSLEAQTKAKSADDVTRDNQLATVRGELQKAKADATVALEALVAERTRTQRVEQQLASIQERTGPRDSRLPTAASSTVGQPSVAAPAAPEVPMKEPTGEIKLATNLATGPAAAPEQGSPQAVRLIARANLLLEQGNIGAARNMLDRAAEMGSTEALFWLAETYDPLLLSARKTFGTQSDIAKARELYDKALAGGVSQAKTRLEALQQ